MTRSVFVENNKTCQVCKLAGMWLKIVCVPLNLMKDLGYKST